MKTQVFLNHFVAVYFGQGSSPVCSVSRSPVISSYSLQTMLTHYPFLLNLRQGVFFFLGRLESWQTGKGVKEELRLSPSLPKEVSKKDCLIFISQWMKRSKHGLFVFLPKKTLIRRRHCSIDQSCCSMTSKRSID